ncbi:hypothetical protein QE152_g6648 [Popillia japonica]|uniref:F-box domain-containing protein n=1 Tax=Popillia japonica TaxID=7064 RepID=A0AAW1ME23_POPJA
MRDQPFGSEQLSKLAIDEADPFTWIYDQQCSSYDLSLPPQRINQEDTTTKMLFEILPAVVYQLWSPGFVELPVELIAVILRYLDPESLLNVVKTYHICKDVCLGDPILRQRLKTLLKTRRRQEVARRARRVNPALGVAVSRTEPATMFGRNAEKIVELRPVPQRECLAGVEKQFFRCKKRKSNDEPQPARKKLVYQLWSPEFVELPVELIAVILRYLDPESLLNVVKTYHICKNVCLGDPILRQRLKTLLKMKKRQEVERRVNKEWIYIHQRLITINVE